MKENENNTIEETTVDNKENFGKEDNKSKKTSIIVIVIIILLIAGIVSCIYFMVIKKNDGEKGKNEIQNNNPLSAYRISGNSLENFDLYFLQLENEKNNKIYSPLSIKYALRMLEDGTSGTSKQQISNIIGSYKDKKYTNSKNMSFANAMFIKDTYKDSVKKTYTDALSNKYNAEIIYDSFKTPNNLNSWISNKTFKLINNLFDDSVSNKDFILVNALAIDMEWVNKIQSTSESYSVDYPHENFFKDIEPLDISDYHELDFNNSSKKVRTVEIGASINKYDIVKELGEDNIRKTVKQKYEKWLADGAENACGAIEEELDANTYVDKYIKEIKTGYNQISSSTDFYFYNDDNVKAFAKDLKKYDGTTLQYIGIMPKNGSLDDYIKSINATKVNSIINNLKSIELNNFKDGVITEISGYIPMFKFEYKLNLMQDLGELRIADVFNANKADLSNLTSSKAVISGVSHKANIEFSNLGIKAAAATEISGAGSGDCGFDYLYDVPVEKIDLTFDNPYLFLIRDKDTGEVWFAGTVYEPMSN